MVGDPGVGKSRLFLEFKGLDRTSGCLVLEGSSVSFGKATAYLPLIDLLRAYFRIDDDDGPDHVREKVIGRLLALALRCHGEMRLKTQGLDAAAPLLQEARELYRYMDRQNDVAAIDDLLAGKRPDKPSARARSGS